MRVRTYCFPGCFTRPPGTSTRNHPHEPTTSKPVVPGGFSSQQVYVGSDRAPDGDEWELEAGAPNRMADGHAPRRRRARIPVELGVERRRDRVNRGPPPPVPASGEAAHAKSVCPADRSTCFCGPARNPLQDVGDGCLPHGRPPGAVPARRGAPARRSVTLKAAADRETAPRGHAGDAVEEVEAEAPLSQPVRPDGPAAAQRHELTAFALIEGCADRHAPSRRRA